jgi:hypothetical protein
MRKKSYYKTIYIKEEDKIYFDILEEYIYQKRDKDINMSSEVGQAIKLYSRCLVSELKLSALSNDFKERLYNKGFIQR